MKFVSIILFITLTCSLGTVMGQEDYEEYKGNIAQEEFQEDKKERSSTEEGGWDWSRFRVGGIFSMQFGTRTYIELSPTLGYFVTDWLQLGVTGLFIYYNQRDDITFTDGRGNFYISPAFKSIMGGGGVFSQFYLYKGLFAHAEYQLINKEPYNPNNPADRINVSHLLIGAGYSTPMGNAGSFYISALFNVLDQQESLYQGTFGDIPLTLRIGFGFGFGR